MSDRRARITALESNFCVTAGAGAGKTTCLVQAYVGQLDPSPGRPGLRPGQLVAITFTEKAAAEMRARVLREVARLASQGHGEPWRHLLGELEWAPINTIHGFCAQILREYGAAAGLDPDFAVLDQEQYDDLANQVCRELLRGHLQRRSQILDALLHQYTLSENRGLPSVLLNLLSQLATAGLSVAQAAQSTDQAYAQEVERLPAARAELAAALDQLAQDLAATKINPAKPPQYLEVVRELLARSGDLLAAMADPERLAGAVAECNALIRGNWGKLKGARDRLVNAGEDLAGLAGLPAARELAARLWEMADELETALAREKTRRAVLGFDDLLLRCLALLEEQPEVLGELRHRFRVFMVDEYQDVNPLQGRLLRRLTGWDQPGAANAPRVLLVGDLKQSIYAFRGAEVAEFGQSLALFAQGAGQGEALRRNFRSSEILINSFNTLFENVFEARTKRAATPESWVDFRPEDRQEWGNRELTDHPQALGVLDLRELGDETTRADGWRRLEAEALAAWLRERLDQGEVAPGEVAILFRRLSQVQVYENALAAAGVDYYTVRGRGFFECQEVRDLVMALCLCLDPGDSVALAGFLRSPLVGLSDQTLFMLTHPEPGVELSLVAAFAGSGELPAWLGPEQQRALAGARRLVAELGARARRLRPWELLAALMEESWAVPIYAATPGGHQRMANLRKLLELTRQAGMPEGGSAATARRLRQLVDDPPQDPQAPLLGEQAQVVRLMSVHQAKGLEFPLVVLPDLVSPRPPGDSLPPLGPGGELAPQPWDPTSGEGVKHTLYQSLSQRYQERQDAEEARLFYVACTRARQRLLFCLVPKPRRGAGCRWRDWVETFVLEMPGVQVWQPSAQPATPPDPAPEASDPAQVEAGRVLARRVMEPQHPALSRVELSVSQLEDWWRCPRLYLFTARLGLDTAQLAPTVGPRPERPTGGDEVRADQMGTWVHRMLELADLGAGPTQLADLADRVVGTRAREHGPRLAELTRGFWDLGVPAELGPVAPDQVRREMPFRLYLPGEDAGPAALLRGEIDLAWPQTDGRWRLVDYKLTRSQDPEPYRDQMRLYALALWLRASGEGPPPRASLCFLGPSPRLAHLEFGVRELEDTREAIRAAARGIATLGDQDDPLALAAPTTCPGKCPLGPICHPEGRP